MKLTKRQRLEADIDLGLVWLWQLMTEDNPMLRFSLDDEATLTFAWRCCRAAYAQGRIDAFKDDDEVAWFVDHGYGSPEEKP